jgi:hypothetical protein
MLLRRATARPPPTNHAEKEDPKVMRVYLVRAQVSGDENR